MYKSGLCLRFGCCVVDLFILCGQEISMPDQKKSVGILESTNTRTILIQQLHFTTLVPEICPKKCLLKLTAQYNL